MYWHNTHTLDLYYICTFSIGVNFSDLFYQSSTYQFQDGFLAMDGRVDTCSSTGFTAGSWWKVNLGEEKTVKSVHIVGKILVIL